MWLAISENIFHRMENLFKLCQVQAGTEVSGYRRAQRYLGTGGHRGIWVQADTEVSGYKQAERDLGISN